MKEKQEIDYEYLRIAKESIKQYKKGSEWYQYYKKSIDEIEQKIANENQLKLL